MTTLKSVNPWYDVDLVLKGDSKSLVDLIQTDIRTYKDVWMTNLIEYVKFDYSVETNLLKKSIWDSKMKSWIRDIHEATEEEKNFIFKEYQNEIVRELKVKAKQEDELEKAKQGHDFNINDLFGELVL